MRYESLVFHRLRCEGCDACQTAAEARKDAADELLSLGEESGRADQYERGLGL